MIDAKENHKWGKNDLKKQKTNNKVIHLKPDISIFTVDGKRTNIRIKYKYDWNR